MTDGGLVPCITETLSTLRRGRLFCLLTKTKLNTSLKTVALREEVCALKCHTFA